MYPFVLQNELAVRQQFYGDYDATTGDWLDFMRVTNIDSTDQPPQWVQRLLGQLGG